MKKLGLAGALLAVVALCAAAGAGLLFIPGSPFWPSELTPKAWTEDLALSFRNAHCRGWYFQYDDLRETLFEIQFDGRENFEKIWPAVLSLKSKGAPLILRETGSFYRDRPRLVRGVQILYPMMDKPGLSHPGIDPNLLKQVLGSSDTPPEYVEVQDGRTRPFTGTMPSHLRTSRTRLSRPLYRVRTDVILVVDSNVVDLNRIPLPADTPIIDQRFQDRK